MILESPYVPIPPRASWQFVLVATVLGFFALVVGLTATIPSRRSAVGSVVRGGATVRLIGERATLTLDRQKDRVTLRRREGSAEFSAVVSIVVDGHDVALALDRADFRVEERTKPDAITATFPLRMGDDTFKVRLSFRIDGPTGSLVVEADTSPVHVSSEHALSVRLEASTGGRAGFVSGVGELSDVASVKGRVFLVDTDTDPVAFVASTGNLEIATEDDDDPEPGSPLVVTVTGPPVPIADAPSKKADVRLTLGSPGGRTWTSLLSLGAIEGARVSGVVTGSKERARLVGRDGSGTPIVRAPVDATGHFDFEAPAQATEWTASVDVAGSSETQHFVPGSSGELHLDIAPGGEVRVRVTDSDSGKPIVARLIVHGIEGTMDPSFGPDYRASGAGPLVDLLRGDVSTPLPPGRYRIAATKGLEWSIDAKEVTVKSGIASSVELSLRHVVPTPNLVSCDLHVHARPSFDSPVSAEDRVLSLVSAGVDFAVPSEHNVVGDYGPALESTGLARELAWVHGVEVTTYAPRFGHFGVYPFPPGPVPPYRGTNAARVFAASRRGDPTRILQVNHPRLPFQIGYFETQHFVASRGTVPRSMRTDFDVLEVYNGFDLEKPERVMAVIRDWYSLLNQGFRIPATASSDSHRIQYQWAGYPRTFAAVHPGADVKGDVDTKAVIDALRSGHSFLTSGPVLEFDVDGQGPGGEVVPTGGTVRAHLRVRAAPWVDVTSVEIVVSGRSVAQIPVATRAQALGPESGTPEEAFARTVRFDQDIPIAVLPGDTWLHVLVRGTRHHDTILPFMPYAPFAFSNPVWIRRR
ncbi:MAG: CehA/McbA family metallohydrolase [Polyangiaceae bacterium]